jgi:15-cis-phytoene synthase
MTTQPNHGWEAQLWRLAGEGCQREAPAPRLSTASGLLARGYAECEAVTAAHSRSFFLATSLLPAPKRQAMRALYAICRISDDLVDCRQGASAFQAWRKQLLYPDGAPCHPVLLAWADTRWRYGLPQRYVEQLLEGVAQDLHPTTLLTFDDLAGYAYRVASTVGLLSMHIIGYASAAAVPYAIKLGVAMQLTNILRDVGEDWRAGRVYLPQAELARFGLGEHDLAAARVDDRWRAFMRFQIDRNRQLYAEAWPGIQCLHRSGRLAVAAAAEFYRAILEDIEAHDFDVFSRRAHVGALRKLVRLPGLWWRNDKPWLPMIS